MGSESSKPNEPSKPIPEKEILLSYPEDRYTFTISYYDYQDWFRKIYDVVKRLPREEVCKWEKSRVQSPEHYLGLIEDWIRRHPVNKRDELKKCFIDGIYKLPQSQSRSRSKSSPASAAASPGYGNPPDYARFTSNISYNTVEEFAEQANKAWNEFSQEERARVSKSSFKRFSGWQKKK